MRILRLETRGKGSITQEIVVELEDDGALVLTSDGPLLAGDVVNLAREMMHIRGQLPAVPILPEATKKKHPLAPFVEWNCVCGEIRNAFGISEIRGQTAIHAPFGCRAIHPQPRFGPEDVAEIYAPAQQETAQQPIGTAEHVPVRHSATDLLSAKTYEAAAIYHPAEPLTDTTKANLFDAAWKQWPVHKKRDRAEKGFMATVNTAGDASLFAQVLAGVLAEWPGSAEQDAPSYTFFATWRDRAAEFGTFAAVAEHGGTIGPNDEDHDIAQRVREAITPKPGEPCQHVLVTVDGQMRRNNRLDPKQYPLVATCNVCGETVNEKHINKLNPAKRAFEGVTWMAEPGQNDAGPLSDDDASFGGPEPEPLQRPNPFRIEHVPSYIPQKVKPFRVVERVGVGTANPKSENRDHFDTVEEALAKYPGASCSPETHAMSARLERERKGKKNVREVGMANAGRGPTWWYGLLVDGVPEGDSFEYLDDAIASNPGVLVNAQARQIAERDGRVSRPKAAAPAPAVPDGPDSDDDLCDCSHIRADHDDDGGPCLYSAGKHCAAFSLKARAVPTSEPSEVVDVNHLNGHGQHFGFYDREEWPADLMWPPSANVALPRGTPPPLRAYVTLGEAITAHKGATVTEAATTRAAEIAQKGPEQRIDWSEADGGFVLEIGTLHGWESAGSFSFLNPARQMHPGVRITERAKAEASANSLWDAPSSK